METIELRCFQTTDQHGVLVCEEYMLDSKPHNPNGPALKIWTRTSDGAYYLASEVYMYRGRFHNAVDPNAAAIIKRNPQGMITDEEHWIGGKRVAVSHESCNNKIVEIDGKKYQLKEI